MKINIIKYKKRKDIVMKKNGFTLAEVLITLAIIGVVATLTLPALMTNTAEQQAKTALKKGISTLTDAAQMNATVKGFDYGAITSTSTNDEDASSLWALLTSQLAVDWTRTKDGKQGIHLGSTKDSENYTIFLRDGSSISFNPEEAVMGDKTSKVMEDDQLPHGIRIVFDTNGIKGPNVLSNCKGEVTSAENDADNTDTACNQKKNRVFKDQYGLRLRNSVVVPNGAAARYIYNN